MKNAILFSVFAFALVNIGTSFGQAQLTNLPTLYITTDNNQVIDSKEIYVPGSLKVVAGSGVPGLYDGRIEIRGRGNATWFAPKKPYRIKLASRYQLLGMPSNARNWALLANYFDDTLLRNALAFEISKFLGFEYTCAYRFVDVYLNGTYLGNYTLTDHVQVEDHRVVVDELSAADTQLPAISGGYFFQEEIYAEGEDGYFQTSHANRYAVKYPDAEDINQQQRDYIVNYVNDYENRLLGPNSLDPVLGYNPVMDRASQVNWQITNELSGNPDAYLSVYMFKKRNDPKLYFGPVWDNDKAFNNSERFADMTYLSMHEVANGNGKIQKMNLDPAFIEAMKNRWKVLRSAGMYEYLDAKIVEFAQQLNQSQALNFNLPDITNQPASPLNFQQRIEKLRAYLKKRTAFLDYQLTREIENGQYYKIANIGARQPISPNSTNDPAVVPKNDSDTDTALEWEMLPDGSGEPGFYRMKNRKTGLVLTQNGTSIFSAQQLPGADPSQRWKIGKIPNQSYVSLQAPTASGLKALSQSGGTLSLNPDLNNLESSSSRRWLLIPTEVNDPALPVVLSSFYSRLEENKVELRWRVAEAADFSHVEILRTTKPGSETAIGQVFLRENPTGSYQFTDHQPGIGLNLYRLRLVDLDGSFTYTPYVRESYYGIGAVTAFPVPARSKLSLSFKSYAYTGPAVATILDQLGQAIVKETVNVTAGANLVSLEVGQLQPGVHHFMISFPDHQVSKRVVIEP
ncbi:hypothetical protein GCM10023091_12540 [Ravibacter arvi]|uniref:Ricin B lectin domain-containing protein n=1 Tax=Ravibacter arvi TaxID=2051041 RepID=A0ABP8LSU0_9BACT